MTSSREEEWKELDFEDLELVRSGGDPGAAPMAIAWSCEYARVAMIASGVLRRANCEECL